MIDAEDVLRRIRKAQLSRPTPPQPQTVALDYRELAERVRQTEEDHAVQAMARHWNHAFSIRTWKPATTAGTREIVRWLKQNIDRGGWGIYKHNQQVIGIREPEHALAFKMRWK